MSTEAAKSNRDRVGVHAIGSRERMLPQIMTNTSAVINKTNYAINSNLIFIKNYIIIKFYWLEG